MTNSGPKARTCDYCGLPAGVSGVSDDSEVYCCFGCRFASAVAQENGAVGHMRWTLTRLGLAIFFSMNVMVFTLVLWSRDVYVVEASQRVVVHTMDELLRYSCLVFSIPVLFLLGGALGESAWSELRNRRVGSDLLLVVGVIAAFGYSIVSLLNGGRHVYFEVGCMVLVVVTLGRWLEATGKLKTTEALHNLAALLPAVVRLLRDGQEFQIPIGQVVVGDHIRVLPGERIPADGTLCETSALIDEQIITGEFRPREKQSGEQVFGGTLNLDSDLTIEVSAPASEGTVQRMIDAVNRAATAKGRWQRLADRLASFFLPTVIVVAIATFATHAYFGGFQEGMLSSLAVVLIACPCALGLATPMAVWVALGRASMAGVLFRDGDALARLASIRAVAYDKTGTLTTGSPEVDALVTDGQTSEVEIRTAAESLAGATTHRLGTAVREFLRAEATKPSLLPSMVETLPGRGLIGTTSDRLGRVYFGSLRFMQEYGLTIPDSLIEQTEAALQQGQPVVALGYDGHVRALFLLRESLRPEAQDILQWGRSEGLPEVVLTGDSQGAVSRVRELGDIEVHAGLLPEEKLDAIAKFRTAHGAVMMVGDGVNDAPALAAADVGVALGCGADVARDSADVCLLGSDLNRIAWAYNLSRHAVRTIRQNLFWAFGYNTVGIFLAAMGWLNPIFAAFAMIMSSLLVISNSLRLAAFPEPGRALSSTESEPVMERSEPSGESDELLRTSCAGGVSG